MARIRRKRSWGRWPHADSRIGGLLFFRAELGVVAFFPGLGSTDLDLGRLEHLPNGFHGDGINDLLSNEEVAQFGQRPTFVGFTKKVRRTQCSLNDDADLFFRKLLGASDAVLRRP